MTFTQTLDALYHGGLWSLGKEDRASWKIHAQAMQTGRAPEKTMWPHFHDLVNNGYVSVKGKTRLLNCSKSGPCFSVWLLFHWIIWPNGQQISSKYIFLSVRWGSREKRNKRNCNFYINQIAIGIARIFLSNKSNNRNAPGAFSLSIFHFYEGKNFESCFFNPKSTH